MSVLTLRVTGDKKPISKKSNWDGTNLKEIIEELLSGSIEQKNGLKDDIESLISKSTVEQQLAQLKELLSKYSQKEDEGTLIFKICSKIYFGVDPKHPIRSGLVRLLTTTANSNVSIEEKLITLFKRSLISTVSKHTQQQPFSSNEASEVITKLSTLYENFPLGASAISSCSVEVIDCICRCLTECQTIFENADLPPAAKQEVSNSVHAAVRLGVQMLQNSQANLDHDSVLKMSSKVFKLMDFAMLPLDTTRNSGLCVVLAHRFVSGRDGCVKFYDELLSKPIDLKTNTGDLILITMSSGLLTGLPIEDLSADNCSLFKKIFLSLKSVYLRVMAVCPLLLCLSRALVALSKSVLLHPGALCLVPDLHQFLISFTWTHLDHHMDSVCHLANAILVNMIKLGTDSDKSIKELGILNTILTLTVKTAAWKKAKHAALIAMSGVVPTSEILAADRSLVETLLKLLQQTTVPSYAVNSVEQLMLQHLREVDLVTWTSVWLDPLLASMEDDIGQNEPFGLKQVLTKAVRVSPQIVNYVLSSDKRNWSVSLSCLQACRKWGLDISAEDDGNKWRGLANYSFLQEAICDKSSQVRLSCFTLLVDCKKTTELFIMEELLLLKSFFELNISENNVAARHQMLRVIGKLLTRIKDSLQSFLRSSKNKVDEEKIEAVEKNYNDFCEWLVQYCFANLFPGASLHRRSTALSVLQMILKTNLWRESANTVENAKLLLLALTDTYEENKSLASELIVSMPAHLFNFDKEDCVKETFEECLRLASGYRPPESVTAAYLLATLVKFPQAEPHLLAITNKPIISVMGREYCTISSILDKLDKQLAVALKDIVEAAEGGPLYGLLFLIRHILEQIDLSCLNGSQEWRDLIGRLLPLCYACSDAVSSVVNSESPEGHLPYNEEGFVEQLAALSMRPDDDPVTDAAQIVLLCSWRTVKESALILGYLAKHGSISQGESKGLLDEEDLLSMGDHLTKLLCETKHRGAFEQAYIGYCKLASRLWSFPEGSLYMIPKQWLGETLQEISTSSDHFPSHNKLFSTRRSGGVPFMIQALICTEMSVGGDSCLSKCMDTLIQIVYTESSTVEMTVHACNVLRALFRNSQLGEAVSGYVEYSFISAIIGFRSISWPVRNAATLLLAALMTRVFGVPRTKGTALSWKNRMTGRIFFLRYPDLYEFLLDELKSIEEDDCTVKPTLYPTLLILSRLYPSSLEGTDSNLKLDAFIPAITNCASSAVMKTRLLAARAVVSLVTPDIFVQHLKFLFSKIFESGKENTTHGLLLQAIELLRSIPTLSGTDEDNLKQLSEQWIGQISKIFESNTLKNSLYVCAAYIEVLSLLHRKYVLKSNELWMRLGDQIEKHLFSNKTHKIGETDFAVTATEFLFEMMVKNVNQAQKCREKVSGINIFLVCLLSHKLYEVRNKALDFMLSLLKPNDDTFNFPSPTALLKDSILNSDVLSRMILSFFFSRKIHAHDFVKVLEVIAYHPKALMFVKKAGGLNLILDLCKSSNETTVCLALDCLLKALQLMETDSKTDVSCYNLESICDIIVENCSPQSNLDYRINIAKWFNSESFTLLKLSELSDLNRLRLWNSLMRLCCDDDIEVHAALFSTYCQVKTIHLFMSKFIIEEASDVVKMMALTAWTVGTFDLQIFNSKKVYSGEKAFDSGELADTFEEPVLSAIAAGHLQNFLIENESLMRCEIPKEFTSWIADSCGIRALESACTISDIGSIIETEISKKSVKLGTGHCAFLKPGFKTMVLSQIKMKNLSQYS